MIPSLEILPGWQTDVAFLSSFLSHTCCSNATAHRAPSKLSWFSHLSHLRLAYLSLHPSRPMLPVLLFTSGYSMSAMTERKLVCPLVRSYWKVDFWLFCSVIFCLVWGAFFVIVGVFCCFSLFPPLIICEEARS